MWSIPPVPHLVALFLPVQNFLLDQGPLLFSSILICLVLALTYWLVVESNRQKWYKSRWIQHNRNAIRQLLILNFALKNIKPKIKKCSACSHSEMELWNHGSNLLVFQCRNCRRNKTIPAHSLPEASVVLENLPGLMIVLNQLRKEPYDALGKHLQLHCTDCELYARRFLNRLPELNNLQVLPELKSLPPILREKPTLPEGIKIRKRTRGKKKTLDYSLRS